MRASLANSAGWMAGSGPSLIQRAEPPMTMPMPGTSTRTRSPTATTKRGSETRRQKR